MFSETYALAKGQDEALAADVWYNEKKGYGFLPFGGEGSTDKYTGAAGWNPAGKQLGQKREASLHQEKWGTEIRDVGFPIRFRADVPENGVYAVTVTGRRVGHEFVYRQKKPGEAGYRRESQ